MKPKVARYFRRGYTMSRRANLSHKNNEHPITHWIKEFALEKEIIKKMLIYAGMHHTGMYAMRTAFYRLPNVDNEKEMNRFYRTFNTISPAKAKFRSYMSKYLQQSVELNHSEKESTLRNILQKQNQ